MSWEYQGIHIAWKMSAFEQIFYYEGRKIKADCGNGGVQHGALSLPKFHYSNSLNIREVLYGEAKLAIT